MDAKVKRTDVPASIGWNGSSLREMLHLSEEQLAQTGHYCGCETLPLKTSDPIRFERIFSRVRGGVVIARETAKRIAASPLVEQMGELCFALYTPEGDSIAMSMGIIVHVNTMSAAIKYIIRNDYESNPGIKRGDIFVNNDPYVSNVHNADVQTMVPIFWEGELVGWAAGVTHEFDYGARTPGGSAVGPINRFEDGLDLPAMRCGENDVLFRDYVERCRRGVRTPLFWTLNEKTRLAGCHQIRSLVEELIRAEGIDTYKRFIREAIEEERRNFRARVREQLVPGIYRAPAFIDYQFAAEATLPPEAAKDGLFHSPLTVHVRPEGKLHLSFEGANGWGYHSFNCTPEAMRGAMWALLAETLMANDRVNDGANLATSLHLPVGSWTNPGVGYSSHSDSWYILVPAFIAMMRPLSRAYQARGYIEEVIAGWGDGNYLQGGSVDQVGESAVISNMEPSCVGAGAGIYRDGLDHASSAWFPTGDMGDVEDWEAVEPLLFLGRVVKPSSGGLGRRRGGLGYESVRVVWIDRYKLQNIGDGKVFSNNGLFGGYPGAAGYRRNVRDTNLEALFASDKPYPVADGDPENSQIAAMVTGTETLDKRGVTMVEHYKRHDLYLNFVRGGPGLGDPLERAIEDVERDLNDNVVLPRFAEKICGAVFSVDADGAYRLDRDATEAKRRQIRKERLQRAIPVREWIAKERAQRIVSKTLVAPVREMYQSSMSLSKAWAKDYRTFWNLDDSFSF